MSDVVRLKIILCDTEPAIWRRVEVPASITLKDLHAIIQAAMGWENYHLYQFHAGRQTINGPGMNDGGFSGGQNITAGRMQLGDLIDSKIKCFDYLYDMGDSWEHECASRRCCTPIRRPAIPASSMAPDNVRRRMSAVFRASTTSSKPSKTRSIPTMKS